MSAPIKTPPSVNTLQDPALEYLMQREIQVALTPIENVTKNVVLEQVTQVVTQVIQINAPQGANGSIQFNQNGSYVGDTGLQFEPTTDTLTTGTVIANSITINNSLKLSGGVNRNFLTTDGNGNTSWADVLPSRVGNSGKFLVTNGVSDAWSTVSYSTLATQTDVANAIDTLVGTAPGILDTLAEIANVIGATDNPEFSIISQLANKANITSLADVAFSGLYSDLSNLPTISTAGRTGNYEDVRNKPTIPTSIADFGISDGTVGQVLTAYGNGTYHFTTVNSGSSTGNITFTDNTMTGTGDVKIHFTPSASPAVEFNFASSGTLTVPGSIVLQDGVITGNDNTDPGIVLGSSDKSVFVRTLGGVDNYTWKFGTDGALTLPSDGKIASGIDTPQVGSTKTIATDSEGGTGAGTPGVVDIPWDGTIINTYPAGSTITFANGDVRTITSIAQGNVGLYLDISYSGAATTSSPEFPIILKTANYAAAITAPEWTFGNNGTLTVPDSITRNDRLTLVSSGAASSNVASVIADGEAGRVFVRTLDGTTLQTWEFNKEGNLMLPNGGDIVDSAGISQFISITSLKTLVAASTDFADFQTRIAAL